MEMWEYEEHQTLLQRTLRDWLLTRDLNTFATLTFGVEDGVDYDMARKVFGTFAHQVKCYLFAEKSKRRIEMVPVIEGFGLGAPLAKRLGIRQGTHIHCLLNLPGKPEDHISPLREMWMNSNSACGDPKVYCPNSNNWFLELDTERRKRIYVNYAVKSCTANTDAVLWNFVPVRRVN